MRNKNKNLNGNWKHFASTLVSTLFSVRCATLSFCVCKFSFCLSRDKSDCKACSDSMYASAHFKEFAFSFVFISDRKKMKKKILFRLINFAKNFRFRLRRFLMFGDSCYLSSNHENRIIFLSPKTSSRSFQEDSTLWISRFESQNFNFSSNCKFFRLFVSSKPNIPGLKFTVSFDVFFIITFWSLLEVCAILHEVKSRVKTTCE